MSNTPAQIEFVSVAEAADELNLSERQVRNLAEEFEWFGGRCGSGWVFTREQVEHFKTFPRRGAGRPRKPLGSQPVGAGA
jgi:hypothetical protein